MFETAPLAGSPNVRPSETKPSGGSRRCGRAPRCRRRESASSGSNGARMRASWPSAASSAASASMWRVTPPGYVHEYGESSAIRTPRLYPLGRRVSQAHLRLRAPPAVRARSRPAGRSRAGGRRPAGLAIIEPMSRAALRQVHVPEARPGLAAAGRRAARAGQARAQRRLRGLRRRPPAAGVLARRHARRRRAAADRRGGEPRPHPRAARRAGPERADEVGADPVLVPGDAQELGVLRRRAHDARAGSGASTCSCTRS